MDDISIDQRDVRIRLRGLKGEHRSLDVAVDALRTNGVIDQLKVARLKKRKLSLKDQIAALEDQLSPDIIA